MARADFEARKRQVLLFVPRFVQERGYHPSTAEIAAGTGMGTSTAWRCVKALREDGVIYTGKTGRQGERRDLVTPEQEHEELVQEAARRLKRIAPNLAEDRLFYVAEQVAKAVERHNAKVQ